MKKNVVILSLILGLTGCHSDKTGHHEDEEGSTTEVAEAEESEARTGVFGEDISTDGAVDVASIYMENPGEEGVEVKVKGEIEEVCQSMGCWVTLKLPDNKSVRVSTDHQFYMPKDISGYIAVVKGTLKKEVTSVADLKHFAEDAGKDEAYINSITESEEEYIIEAVGILIIEEE